MIDPACGSGHLVIGSFKRIADRLARAEPAASRRELVIRALACVHGIDINPFAAAIARFRLLLAAMQAAGVTRLADAPAFSLQIACGDSLLHASMIRDEPARYTSLAMEGLDEATKPKRGGKKSAAKPKTDADEACDHVYAAENLDVLRRLLARGQYHAVVANPPYITPKDPILNERYRKRFGSCHMKYSLSVPFLEQIFLLAAPGGFTGQITANSFMKREFGKKLIESFFPTQDLTHVIDTSGAYIPGHGTPTVILSGRRRDPVLPNVRAVMGIRGEPTTPDDPTHGLVWTAITSQIDAAGSASDFVSVADTPRASFHSHPWSIGGGGAADLKELLDDGAQRTLVSLVDSIGFASFPGQDEAFIAAASDFSRGIVPRSLTKPFVTGDVVRDWCTDCVETAFSPYDEKFEAISLDSTTSWAVKLWPYRTSIGSVVSFGGKTRLECGDTWWTWYRWVPDKYRTRLSITFAFVATHNHFVLDRGGKVFNRSAPVIKLPPEASEDDHLSLLAPLNSSTACFWMKQVFHTKGNEGIQSGLKTEAWEKFWEFTGTGLESFPLPASRPLDMARRIQALADAQATVAPAEVIRRWTVGASADPPPAIWPTLKRALEESAATWRSNRRLMIALQEELDWQCYRLYGLTTDELTYPLEQVPGINLGERAFEIVLARRVAAGEVTTTWFERHGSTPIMEIPAHWPANYKALVQQRIDRISGPALDANIRLIEQPEYKRRWNTTPYAEQTAAALRSWLLDRIESYFDFDGRMNDAGQPTARFSGVQEGEIVSVARIADEARRDPLFQEAGEVYRDDRAFDVLALVTDLVASEAVPALPVERYKPSGLLKRKQWERTWELQRAEDAIDDRVTLPDGDPKKLSADEAAREKANMVGEIPVPPKYAQADFLPGPFWRLRGKLDVPKERFVSFPSVTTADGTPLVAWAGSNHLQLAKAVSGLFVDIRDRQGTHDDARLLPLLAVLVDLLPWLRQYHGEIDPEFDASPADSFATFVAEEGRKLGKSTADLAQWAPPPKAKRAKKAAKKKASKKKPASPDTDPDEDVTNPPVTDDDR
jgi:hypothetical protein